MEPRGVGVNENAYWVCNSPEENKWTALPDLEPKDIEIARKIKFYLSGDINCSIITNPFFHKKEAHLLRAQIARISAGTALAPKGVFKLTEDNPNAIEENLPEEGPIPIPSTKEMGQASNWVHHVSSILHCNRTTLMEMDAPDGEEPEDFMRRRQLADPSERRLKPITEDRKVSGNSPAWTVRTCGD